jgi:hypothetical protein
MSAIDTAPYNPFGHRAGLGAKPWKTKTKSKQTSKTSSPTALLMNKISRPLGHKSKHHRTAPKTDRDWSNHPFVKITKKIIDGPKHKIVVIDYAKETRAPERALRHTWEGKHRVSFDSPPTDQFLKSAFRCAVVSMMEMRLRSEYGDEAVEENRPQEVGIMRDGVGFDEVCASGCRFHGNLDGIDWKGVVVAIEKEQKRRAERIFTRPNLNPLSYERSWLGAKRSWLGEVTHVARALGMQEREIIWEIEMFACRVGGEYEGGIDEMIVSELYKLRDVSARIRKDADKLEIIFKDREEERERLVGSNQRVLWSLRRIKDVLPPYAM